MDVLESAKPITALKGSHLVNVLSFGALKREHGLIWPLPSGQVSLSPRLFRDLLRCALGHIHFDEYFYLQLYPDVADALANGRFTDAHHHYVEFGYFEDRLPFRIEVDEAFYFRTYPDIAAEVSAGTMLSAQVHFELYGYSEGRLPREGWSLAAG
jgi:hypothetical protein